jgi:hypothetical protein
LATEAPTLVSLSAGAASVARDELVISSLLCHAHVEMALICLGSLARFSDRRVRLILHDDGSLTDEDMTRLLSHLSPARVVRRAKADERMAEELRRFPASASFRNETCMGLKLLDSLYFNSSDIYCYSDADVLFLRPFRDLFRLPDGTTNALFMHDSWGNCYSFRSWQLLTTKGIKLPQRINAGLSCIRRSKYDPDFIEWFLRNPKHAGNRHHGVPEQTAWAVLGARVGCRKWHPENVAVGHPHLNVTDRLIAAHFVGMFRHALPAFAAVSSKTSPEGSRTAPQTIGIRRCTSAHLAVGEAVRVFGRLRKNLQDR